MSELKQKIDELIRQSGEKVSVLVKELKAEEAIYDYNSTVKMISASTIKVPVTLAALEEVRKGNLSLDDRRYVPQEDIFDEAQAFENGPGEYTLAELLSWMNITSDNTATNTVIKWLGMDRINAYIKEELGAETTELQRLMMDTEAVKNGFNNYTSQEDLMVVFRKLFAGEILTEELCSLAIEILYNQRHQDQVMRYIYEPVKYAHKTGSLSHLNHDAGVMHIKGRNFYVGVSVYDSPNTRGNRKLSGNIGRAVYEYLRDSI